MMWLPESDLAELSTAIESDSNDGDQNFGDQTKAWLKALPRKLATGVVSVGADVVKSAAKQWLMQYFGIDV